MIPRWGSPGRTRPLFLISEIGQNPDKSNFIWLMLGQLDESINSKSTPCFGWLLNRVCSIDSARLTSVWISMAATSIILLSSNSDRNSLNEFENEKNQFFGEVLGII